MRSKDLPYHATFDRQFIDESWLARREEVIFDRERPIVDPHHHIWTAPRPAYSADDLLDDLTAGHNVRATIYMESGEHWHRTGPEHLRSVGETSHALDIAQQYSNSSGPKVAAGIISHADLTLGRDSEATLHAHRQAGGTHFKGVRAYLFWDEKIDIGIANPAKGLAASSAFRTGFSKLAPLGLVCDVMAYYTNLPEIAELAAAFPATDIVLNHCGGPVGAPPYDADPTGMFGTWRQNLKKLACYPNVWIKIGGMGGPFFGPLMPLHLRSQSSPPGSEQLAAAMRPFVDVCIELCGPKRCMFESNFPADKYDYSYTILWNAFKRLAHAYSETEKDALFLRTAAQFYRLEEMQLS